eukprot:GHRQ01016647.1.p1 GENE.GHRQ01016647.1~~GHRQ01016647.1.p1  ORF type:complete len:256 (+),score=113.32 GHRQ01016647.1:788-1555(+)
MHPQVSPDEPLMAAGLDSLGSVELRNTLEGRLALLLPPTLVFDFPTAAAIAEFAAARMPSPTASSTGALAPARPQQLLTQPGAFDDSLFRFDEGVAAAGRQQQQLASPTALRSQQEVEADVAAAVASVLGRSVESSAALMAAGLDSLGSVELQNVLQSRFEVPLPATMAIDYPSVEAMALYIHSRLAAVAAATAAPAVPAAVPAVRGMPAAAPGTRAGVQQAAAVYGAAFRMPGMQQQQQLMQGVDAIQVVPMDR